MKNQGIGQTIDSLNDDFLENIINNHFSFDSEDMDAVDKVLVYRQICMPLEYRVNDKRSWKKIRKEGFQSREECLDGESISTSPIFMTFSLEGVDGSITLLAALTQMKKAPDEIKQKANAYVGMPLREIYERYIKGTDIVGIYIFGAKDAYVVTTERIEKLLNVDEPKEC